jgi:hypothetical protein
MPDKEYQREIQGMSSVGFLTKNIEERYWEGLQSDARQRYRREISGKVYGGIPDKEYRRKKRFSVGCPTNSIEERYWEGFQLDVRQRLSKRDTGKVFGGIPDKEYQREIQERSSMYPPLLGMCGSYT